MSHPLLVMPLPFRTVRSLRRRSKDNTGLNLQGPDVNRESREQISGQHRGVRRSPWMPPFPLPAQNRVESGKIGFLRVESGIIGSGSSTRPPKSSSKGPVVAKSPFGPQTAVLYQGILGEFGGGLGAGLLAPLAGPQPSSSRFRPDSPVRALLPPPTPRLGVSESQVGREGLGVSPRGPPPREPPKRNNVRKGHRFLSIT